MYFAPDCLLCTTKAWWSLGGLVEPDLVTRLVQAPQGGRLASFLDPGEGGSRAMVVARARARATVVAVPPIPSSGVQVQQAPSSLSSLLPAELPLPSLPLALCKGRAGDR